ncbi:MAG: helix-turn-helix transcriptional regulator [Clostridia bacterium]
MILTVIIGLISLVALAFFIWLIVLIVRALLKYIKSKDVRYEKSETRKTLGEALKQHRNSCKMTQEFVAEAIGVSRQAVSKWESGSSDPSTSNLIALAKLFDISPEDLIKELQ